MGEFLSSNSGMASRFNETVTFRDYKADELTEIFRRQVKKEHLTLDEEAEAFIRNYFSKMYLTVHAISVMPVRYGTQWIVQSRIRESVAGTEGYTGL